MIQTVIPPSWQGLRVAVAPANEPPFPVECRIVEDDTWRVLGADPEFRPAREHPIRVMQAAHDAQPLAPGEVVVEEGTPARLYAIVYDLDRDPMWRAEWFAQALARALRLAGDRRCSTLALPLPGARHARLPARSSIAILGRVLASTEPASVERLWLIA